MTSPLGIGIIAIVAALVLFVFVLFQPYLVNLRSEQMRTEELNESASGKSSTPVFDLIDRVMDRFGLKGYSENDLAQAGIKIGGTSMVAITLLVAMSAFMITQVVTRSLFLSLLAAIGSPFLVRFFVSWRTTKRKEKFSEQMGDAMTLLSSALKSGMNVPTAMANVATEMEPPMGDELARIVNEARLGRDMVNAMHETAERMESDDFKWVTDAVAIQRESGGRLSEILDRVTETIAERNELRLKIQSLAAEGKASAIILMALPIGVGVLFGVINSDFMAPLFTTFAGYVLLGVAAVFYALGGFWLSRITKVKL